MAELSWEMVEQQIANCRRCGLCEQRHSIVLGEGNRSADIMLVGEDVGQMVGTIKSVLFKGVHYEMMIDTGAYTFKVHSTTMQPQGSRVGLNIVPFNIHIMKRLEDTTPAAEVDAEC